jgi:hypothetical protein
MLPQLRTFLDKNPRQIRGRLKVFRLRLAFPPTISLLVVAALLPISVKSTQTVFGGHGGTNMRHHQKLELRNPPLIRIEIAEQEAIDATP